MYSSKVKKDNGVLLYQTGKLTGFNTTKEYPEKLRRIKFYDEETDKHLTFLSNNFDLTAEEIAQLYKCSSTPTPRCVLQTAQSPIYFRLRMSLIVIMISTAINKDIITFNFVYKSVFSVNSPGP